ncbi:ZNF3 protein, partial [Amia calva]|nr:ZNF3 protein [Amia calva]
MTFDPEFSELLFSVLFSCVVSPPGAVEASALPDSGQRAPIEQQPWEQEWDSSLRQDTEPTATEDIQGLSEQPRSRQSEEELRGQESGHMAEPHTEGSTQGLGALGSDTTGSKIIKSDPELDCTHTADLCRTQSLGSECGPNAAGAEPVSTRTQWGPSLLCDHIKTEDDTLESVYTVEPRTQTPFRDALSHLKIENITDSAWDLWPELPVAGQYDLGSELPVAGQCDPESAALRTGLSGGSDSAVSVESPSSRHRQLRPRPPRPQSSSSSPSSPLWCGKQLPHRQPQCRKSFTGASEIIGQHHTPTGGKLFHCVQCGKSFSRAGNLNTHQRIHTGQRPYCCAQCGRMFSDASDFNKHQQIHTGERPYSCAQCGRSFARASNLNTHQRIHTGERPYCCAQCGRGFSRVSTLNTHQRVHTGERPYCCAQCGRAFSSASSLYTHQRVHTGERPFCCTLCGMSFSRADRLNAHQRSHTGEKPYHCDQCGKSFSVATNLNRHKRIHTRERL